jgi:hypothetical protein
MEYVTVGMTLPESLGETSWTAIDRDEYVEDMRLVGKDVEKQVEVDVPRIDLQIQERNSCCIPVKNGKIFHRLLRDVIQDASVCDAVLACCTQTSLAQPMRALHSVLPDDTAVMESQQPLRVRVHLKRGGASVRTSKILRLARLGADGPTILRNISLVVEYSSQQTHVMVGVS